MEKQRSTEQHQATLPINEILFRAASRYVADGLYPAGKGGELIGYEIQTKHGFICDIDFGVNARDLSVCRQRFIETGSDCY